MSGGGCGRRWRGLVAAAALVVGCEGGRPEGPPAVLLTLGSLRAAFDAAPNAPLGAGISSVFSAGFPPAYFLAARDEIRIAPAFTEGQPSAYISTDVWLNFPVVWAQPLYVFVAPGAGPPESRRLDLPWVAAVGPASAFWSPYFRVTYVEVPAGTDARAYRTVRAVLNARLPMTPGPTRLLTVLPDAEMQPEDPSLLLLPPLREAGRVGLPLTRSIWIDGRKELASALDFGLNRFEIGARDEVVEQPLFFFFGRNEAGAWGPYTGVPRVGGTGPIGVGAPARAPGNVPVYGSLWRLWAARLPASARLFVPRPRRPEWEARSWGGEQLAYANHPAVLDTQPGVDAFAFRVLPDETCAAAAMTVAELAECPFLDSQAALERHLGAGLVPSEILVTCPFVAHAGQAVPSPMP